MEREAKGGTLTRNTHRSHSYFQGALRLETQCRQGFAGIIPEGFSLCEKHPSIYQTHVMKKNAGKKCEVPVPQFLRVLKQFLRVLKQFLRTDNKQKIANNPRFCSECRFF